MHGCREQKAAAAAKAAVKQQNKRNATLLSFDEEEEAEEDTVARAKIRSYHDAVEDKRQGLCFEPRILSITMLLFGFCSLGVTVYCPWETPL